MNVKIEQSVVDEIKRQLSKGAEDKVRAGFLTGMAEADRVVVDGVYVPEQESDQISTIITPEEVTKSFEAIRCSGKSVVGFAHYNSHFAAYESAVTRQSREKLAQMGISNLGLVINAKGEYNIF